LIPRSRDSLANRDVLNVGIKGEIPTYRRIIGNVEIFHNEVVRTVNGSFIGVNAGKDIGASTFEVGVGDTLILNSIGPAMFKGQRSAV